MNQVVLLIVFSLCHALALSGPVKPIRSYAALEHDENRTSYILVDNGNGTYRVEDFTTSKIQATAAESDVTYFLYNKNNSECTVIKNLTVGLAETTLDPSKEVVLTIHGWNNDYTSPVNAEIKSAILENFDLNFIVVDWSPLSTKNYITAKNAVPEIGKFVGNFINTLASIYQIPLSKISLIGHSLGAHVAGIAGSVLNGGLDHIVGLDPASPLISVSNKAYCLDTSDAQYVEVIHTNGALLGLTTSIGHSDYFPNGGQHQPGCGLDITGSCSHGRSYEYYAASIKYNKFISQQCNSYSEFTKGLCSGNFSLMGGYRIEKKVFGDFYLSTTDSYPYTMKKNIYGQNY